MKHIIKTAIIAIAISVCMGSFAESSEAKRADIRKLMEITGSGDLGVQMASQMIPSLKQMAPELPEAFWSEFMAQLDVDKLVELCIPSYEKHFTHDEIRELLKFYETPLGKKMISVQPQIMQECMVAGQQWGQEIGALAIKKVQQYQECNQ